MNKHALQLCSLHVVSRASKAISHYLASSSWTTLAAWIAPTNWVALTVYVLYMYCRLMLELACCLEQDWVESPNE